MAQNKNNDLLDNWEQKTAQQQKAFKQYLHRANKNRVLKALPNLHNEAFDKIDCLTCANCCKNYSPRFKGPDIRRIAKHLDIKETEFKERYLKVDEDEDFVAQTLPCPFLNTDNTCNIYEVRPSDCARFPYTDEDVILKRQKITLKNSSFCPATYYVLNRLMQEVIP
jgi:uncharacterized protein